MKFVKKEMEPEPKPGAGSKETGMARDGGSNNAFLGKGCSFDGKLTFEGLVQIDGRFSGEIYSNDVLEIGPDAEVKAELEVGTVIIGGRVIGNVRASKRVDLKGSADVKGNIEAPVVTMQEGAIIDGNMRMTGKPDKAKKAPVKMPETMTLPSKKDPTILP